MVRLNPHPHDQRRGTRIGGFRLVQGHPPAGREARIRQFLAGIQRLSARLLILGGNGKHVLGVLMLALGAMMLSGTDKVVENWLVAITPDWLLRATTAI
jgi:hypothetical protein